MRVFAHKFADARYVHEVYRALSDKGKARRLKVARAAVDHPESTCPKCHYDLSGIFTDDDPPRPCPECGQLVSPAIAVMVWCRERKAYNRNTCIAAFSGLLQAVLAWIYIFLAGAFGGSPEVQKTFLVIWIVGFILNAIVLPFSIWKMQLATTPDRHPVVAAIVSIVGACGSLASTLIFLLLIPAALAVFLKG